MDNDKYQILIVSASAAADDMRLSLAEEGFTAVEISDYDNVLEHIPGRYHSQKFQLQ